MTNLLEETIEKLKENGKDLEDVLWVGCRKFQIPMSKFLELANDEYHSGYGIEEVASDLIVVGSDFWLERNGYDGSEWWEFKSTPKMPKMNENYNGHFMRGKDGCEYYGWNRYMGEDE